MLTGSETDIVKKVLYAIIHEINVLNDSILDGSH